MDLVATQTDSREPLPQKTLGGFSLVRKLAAGGMATVYLGHRKAATGASEFAAVKVMLPRLSHDEEYLAMFFDEARLTSSITHPRVCKVLGYGAEAGFHYLATEYVLGETWADLVDALHQSPEGKAAAPLLLSHVLAQTCEGLHAVHETHDEQGRHLGIVHRDVSPQNIMIGYDGSVRVLDFGIASATDRLHETRDGVLKGHLAYMAPEQVQILPVDRRSDIWPIGVMLWEGVTGRRLFKRADSRATMKAVTSEELTPLLRDASFPSPALLSVIERSVVRNPAGRFATAQEMGNELSSLGAANMTSAQLASWMRHLFAKRFDEKRRHLLASSAGGVPGSVAALAMDGDPGSAQSSSPSRTRLLAVVSRAQRGYERAMARAATVLPPVVYRALRPLVVLSLFAGGFLLRYQPPLGAGNTSEHAVAGASTSSAVVATAATVGNANGTPTGTLDVRAIGTHVRVECEGRDLGVPPLRIELAPGRHLFRIVPGHGQAAANADVVIESGEHYLMEIDRGEGTALVARSEPGDRRDGELGQ